MNKPIVPSSVRHLVDENDALHKALNSGDWSVPESIESRLQGDWISDVISYQKDVVVFAYSQLGADEPSDDLAKVIDEMNDLTGAVAALNNYSFALEWEEHPDFWRSAGLHDCAYALMFAVTGKDDDWAVMFDSVSFVAANGVNYHNI